jgi:hypothetical protein
MSTPVMIEETKVESGWNIKLRVKSHVKAEVILSVKDRDAGDVKSQATGRTLSAWT